MIGKPGIAIYFSSKTRKDTNRYLLVGLVFKENPKQDHFGGGSSNKMTHPYGSGHNPLITKLNAMRKLCGPPSVLQNFEVLGGQLSVLQGVLADVAYPKAPRTFYHRRPA